MLQPGVAEQPTREHLVASSAAKMEHLESLVPRQRKRPNRLPWQKSLPRKRTSRQGSLPTLSEESGLMKQQAEGTAASTVGTRPVVEEPTCRRLELSGQRAKPVKS